MVFFTAEDEPGDTLRPRLEAAGGDPARFLAVTTVKPKTPGGLEIEYQPTLRDVTVVARAIEQVQAKLVIFDPFMAYLDRETNSGRDQDVRAILAPLARLAERAGTAILFVRHLNKATGLPALYRGGGSIGIIGAARTGLIVGRAPDDEQTWVLASTKNNLGRPPRSLAYTIADGDGAVIAWRGESPHGADALVMTQLSGQVDARVNKSDQAQALLLDMLADGPQPEEAIQARAAEQQVSLVTLRRVKRALGIVSKKDGGRGRWHWSLPEDDPADGGEPSETDLHAAAMQGDHSKVIIHTGHMTTLGTGATTPRQESAAPATTAAPNVCPATGGAHEYALRRDAHYHRICAACDRAEGVEG